MEHDHTTMGTIVLMGPIGAGKSTQAELLSKKLGRPRCAYDDVKECYRTRIGFDPTATQTIHDKQGLYAMLCYMNEFKSQIWDPSFRTTRDTSSIWEAGPNVLMSHTRLSGRVKLLRESRRFFCCCPRPIWLQTFLCCQVSRRITQLTPI